MQAMYANINYVKLMLDCFVYNMGVVSSFTVFLLALHACTHVCTHVCTHTCHNTYMHIHKNPIVASNSVEGVHGLSTQMGQLQISTTGGATATYTGQPQHTAQYHINTAHGTQYAHQTPTGWTIQHTPIVQQVHVLVKLRMVQVVHQLVLKPHSKAVCIKLGSSLWLVPINAQ